MGRLDTHVTLTTASTAKVREQEIQRYGKEGAAATDLMSQTHDRYLCLLQ